MLLMWPCLRRGLYGLALLKVLPFAGVTLIMVNALTVNALTVNALTVNAPTVAGFTLLNLPLVLCLLYCCRAALRCR